MLLDTKLKKWVLLTVLSALLIGVSIYMIRSLPPAEKGSRAAPTPTPTLSPHSIKKVTLEGQVICLQYKDSSSPHTLECAIGIKTDEGVSYALDTNKMPNSLLEYTTGDRIRGEGFITPVEMLSSDQWQKYEVRGIFSLTDRLQILQ